jgi:hypothetical protein
MVLRGVTRFCSKIFSLGKNFVGNRNKLLPLDAFNFISASCTTGGLVAQRIAPPKSPVQIIAYRIATEPTPVSCSLSAFVFITLLQKRTM